MPSSSETKPNRAHFIIKNAVSNYIRYSCDIVILILLTPFIASRLGTTQFGLWSLLWSAVSLFGIMDLGFANAVVKFIADARGRKDLDRLRHITATLFWVYIALGCIALIATCIITPYIPSLLHIPADLAYPARIVFLLLAFRAVQALPLNMFKGILVGFQKLAWSNYVKTIWKIIYALLVVYALSLQPDIRILAFISFITGLLCNLILMALALTRLDGIHITPRLFKFSYVRTTLSFSVYFFIVHIAGLIYTRVDSIIITQFLPLEFVAFYGVAARVSHSFSTFARQFASSLSPLIAELKGAGDEANIQSVFTKGAKLSIAMATPLAAGLLWFAHPLITAWMGMSFEHAVAPLRVLIIASFVSVAMAQCAMVLSMAGHQKYTAYSFISGQVINLFLTLLLIHFGIKYYGAIGGLVGVAAATLVSQVTVDCIIIYRKIARVFSIPFFRFILSAVLPAFPALVCMIAFFSLLYYFGLHPSATHYSRVITIALIALYECIGCVIFGVVFYFSGFSRKERTYYSNRILSFLRHKKEES